jgi:hypothetical protein
MILQKNQEGKPNVARCPWDPGIVGAHKVTISGAEWFSQQEVDMSYDPHGRGEYHKGYFELDCSDPRSSSAVLWTKAASGGCWPFGVIVRNREAGGAAAKAIGLAHLATKRDEEAALFGFIFKSVGAPAEDVYIIVMVPYISDTELGFITTDAFGAFERGYGTILRNENKLLVITTTVNSAVSRHGHFGELTNADVEALENPNSTQNHLRTRPCNILLSMPTVRERSTTL